MNPTSVGILERLGADYSHATGDFAAVASKLSGDAGR
jgi:hypothetical protein